MNIQQEHSVYINACVFVECELEFQPSIPIIEVKKKFKAGVLSTNCNIICCSNSFDAVITIYLSYEYFLFFSLYRIEKQT